MYRPKEPPRWLVLDWRPHSSWCTAAGPEHMQRHAHNQDARAPSLKARARHCVLCTPLSCLHRGAHAPPGCRRASHIQRVRHAQQRAGRVLGLGSARARTRMPHLAPCVHARKKLAPAGAGAGRSWHPLVLSGMRLHAVMCAEAAAAKTETMEVDDRQEMHWLRATKHMQQSIPDKVGTCSRAPRACSTA